MKKYSYPEYRKAWKAKNAEKLREQARAYNEANKERIAAQKREYYLKNKEKIDQRTKEWQQNNRQASCEHTKNWQSKNKEKVANAAKEWKLNNREHWNAYNRAYRSTRTGMVNHYSRLRYCAKRQRTPLWANLRLVKSYYEVCTFFNEVNGYTKYHVDHIIPLQGDSVSGLHVHNNLQVILAKENMEKGNKYHAK
jgi:hypothetical protein